MSKDIASIASIVYIGATVVVSGKMVAEWYKNRQRINAVRRECAELSIALRTI